MSKVGKRILHLEDRHRRDWRNEGARPLLTEVWYPATEDSPTAPFVFGSPEPLFHFPPISIDGDLLSEDEAYPLVVMSHGTGGSALQMGWLARHLAAHGYVAAAVNHHGNNVLESYMAHGFLLWWERATDLSVLIDLLLDEATDFKLKINRNRIGVVGFSLGGYTAVELVGGRCSLKHFRAFCASVERDGICDGPREFPDVGSEMSRLELEDPLFRESLSRHDHSYKDKRVKAAFLLAPALGMAFSEPGLADVDVPVHIVVPESDSEVPPGTNGRRFAELIRGARLEVLEGAVDHYVFLCEATPAGKRLEPWCCVDDPSVDRRQVHQRVAERAVAFFGQTL